MRKYRVNPLCPNCGEEHCYWEITLTDDEQMELDRYYETRKTQCKRQTAIANLLDDIAEKPLVIKRELTCGACHKTFEARITVLQEDEVGNNSPDMIPMGLYPV